MSVVGDYFWRHQSRLAFWYRYTWRLRRGAAKIGGRMRRMMGAADGAKLKGPTAVVPFYGDQWLLPWFLNYYRTLGVGYFVFLDLDAKQTLHEGLAGAADCAVWRPEGFMHPGNTIHALNFLRHRYAMGRWCLSVDPFDLLVFPKCETRHVRDLIDFVDSEKRDHVAAVVVDAYGDVPARGLDAAGGARPEALLPYFDRFGYQTAEATASLEVPILGGVQRRALFGDAPRQAPPLNRIPLVKINKDVFYIAATRKLVPHTMNTPHSEWHSSTTACLVRYAMLGDEVSLHVAKQAEGGELYPENMNALYQGSERMAALALKNQNSGRFSSSQDLLDCGLLNNGQWF
jgi:hypothetical protein